MPQSKPIWFTELGCPAIDRGTKYGIQSGRRIESVLASLPPLVAWKYDHHPQPGSPEAALLSEFLPPKDWI